MMFISSVAFIIIKLPLLSTEFSLIYHLIQMQITFTGVIKEQAYGRAPIKTLFK